MSSVGNGSLFCTSHFSAALFLKYDRASVTEQDLIDGQVVRKMKAPKPSNQDLLDLLKGYDSTSSYYISITKFSSNFLGRAYQLCAT